MKKLDDKILKESETRDKKEAALDDHRSQKSRAHSQTAKPEADTRSVMSGASALSKGSKHLAAAKAAANRLETASVRSGSQGAMTEVYSELNEDDEWTAIQKFNTLLHYEEQKQALMRDRERKRLIKEELDKQLNEKSSRKRAEF